MKLIVATHNQHKIREISQILPDFEIIADDPEGVEENAPDFAGNALIKVRAIAAKHAGAWCLADDSGLEVEALGGAPGVRSARYAGEPANTPNNNALLMKNMAGVTNRRANFTCAVALVDPAGVEHVAVGKCFGRIAEQPSGSAGFGYDPLFIPDGHDKSFADLTADEKNAISHRGRALEKAREILQSSGQSSNRLLSWLRFFRVVNLPTLPGDVMVGAAAILAASPKFESQAFVSTAYAAIAAMMVYLYGLADNDIVGAATDKGRPISDGEISLAAARFARGLCWGAVLILGAVGNLPPFWWVATLVLFACIAVYNRTKSCLLMGLCRGLNFLCGAMAVCNDVAGGIGESRFTGRPLWLAASVALLWTLYIAGVTKYSEGEELSPSKKKTVGMLIGALIYLQLGALVSFTLQCPALRAFLIVGACLLVLLRFMKYIMPKVSAS